MGAVACFSLSLLACKLGTTESTWDAFRKGSEDLTLSNIQ